MATKKFMSLERLTEYDGLIKSYIGTEVGKKADSKHDHDDRYYTETEIDDKLSTINNSITNITDGSTVVKKAEHAASADSATSANSAAEATHAVSADSANTATKATQDASGNVITNTYETKEDATAKLNEAKGYTDDKVKDLITSGDVDTKITTHNSSTDAHSDIRDEIAAIKEDVDYFFKDALKDEADAQKYKDTLKEIQDYITSDATAAEELANKADKEHDHKLANVTDVTATAAELNFMSGVTSNVQEQLDAKDAAIEAVKVEASNQDAVVLLEAQQSAKLYTDSVAEGKADADHDHAISDVTGLQDALNSKLAQTTFDAHTATHAPANAQANVIESIKVNGTAQTVTDKAVDIIVPTKASDIGAAESGHGHDVATESANGFMSAEMVTKLKGIAEGATAVTVDSALSETSTNPVQNKVVYGAVGTLTSAVSANTSSITAHSTAITNLQTAVSEIQEITSEEIANLFK